MKAKWQARKYGIQLGYNLQTVITNLRFADDILLIGRTLPQIKQMIADVATEGAKVGLQLHPEKTKILHNNIGYGSGVKSAQVKDMSIEVLGPSASAMYLGKVLSLTNTRDVELAHRINKAWVKFVAWEQELTDREVPLDLRLKLFQSVISPTILYGSGSWVMTGAREAALQTTQMKMLRSICARKRRTQPNGELEPLVD